MERSASPQDARQNVLTLTALGREVFEPLQQRSRDEAAALLAPLPPARQQELVAAMERIEALLNPANAAPTATRMAVLRDPVPGDIGWVVQQHGEVYWREYGWDNSFEALVADIAAQFVRKFQPAWERCWVAELDGERVGAVFVVRKSATTAQPAMALIAMYESWGYQVVGECDWRPLTNYTSVLMAHSLAEGHHA